MTIRTCATCLYSRPQLTQDGMEPLPEGVSEYLFCQRFPPTLPGPVDGWAAVSPGECCGEWCSAAGDAGHAGHAGDALDDGDEATLEDLLCELTAITISRFNHLDARFDALTTAIQRATP